MRTPSHLVAASSDGENQLFPTVLFCTTLDRSTARLKSHISSVLYPFNVLFVVQACKGIR